VVLRDANDEEGCQRNALAVATQASGATCVPVSHGAVFCAVKRIASRAGVPLHVRALNKKPASAAFLAGFFTPSSNRIASHQRNRWCRGPDSKNQ